jgi:amino acid permease
MLVLVAILLALAWIIGIAVVKVSSFAIHVLLALALVSVVAHLLRWRGRHT